MKTNLSVVALVFLVSLLFGSSNIVSSSEVFPKIYPDTYSLKNPLIYIFVATVEQKFPNHDKKHGPEDFAGVLNITEVMRGHDIEAGRISVRWNPTDETMEQRVSPLGLWYCFFAKE